MQGGVSPAEGKFHSRQGSNEIKASSPSGGKTIVKIRANHSGGRAPETKYGLQKAADKKDKTNRSTAYHNKA